MGVTRMGKTTIFLADDDEGVRRTLRTFFEGLPGYRVVGEACDGMEAVEGCRASAPDVALLDIQMPLLDGVSVARQVLADRAAKCVIILTAFSDREHIERVQACGAAGYLTKPFEAEKIYDGVTCNDKLRVCFDTCHTHDSGYPVRDDFDGVIEEFDRILGKDQIAVFHINDSKNPQGAKKDRHANIGQGEIGFDALAYIVHHPDFMEIPKILETPYLPSVDDPKKTLPPYRHEIEMLRKYREKTVL